MNEVARNPYKRQNNVDSLNILKEWIVMAEAEAAKTNKQST